MSSQVSDTDVARILTLLAERTRATERIADSFQPPQVGLIEEAGARRHQLVVGRRGVGKSMLLLNLIARAKKGNQLVVSIDMESYRGIPYPDVLIRVLAALAEELVTQLKSEQGWLKGRHLRRGLARLRIDLLKLLEEPHEQQTTVVAETEDTRSSAASAGASVGVQEHGLQATGSGQIGMSQQTSSRVTKQAEFVHTKMGGLQATTPEYRQLLKRAVEALDGRRALVVLDDFYFIPRSSQPDVLAYLHQLAKGLEIWLKIGGVEHRLEPYVDGDPPRGLQPYHDAGLLQLDATLRDFGHTKGFLEGILSLALADVGVELSGLLTDTARERLVLASGGVPRDYLSLTAEALKTASKRGDNENRPRNRINAEDIGEVAPALLQQKEQELRLDANPAEVERLRTRFDDIVKFCSHDRGVNVFLVESTALRETEWGRDIAALTELRFVHSIGNLTVKSGSEKYTGRRYEGFVLDLSAYVVTRVRSIEMIPFWETDGFQRIRGARFVYTPSSRGEGPDPRDEDAEDWDQLEFEVSDSQS